jgi:hypothetical protein
MQSKARVVAGFVAVSALVMIVALASIFAGGLKPQLVAPVAGMAIAVNVFVFVSRFKTPQKDYSISASAEPSPQIPQQSNPGITVLKVLIIAAMCVLALNVVIFAVEAWRGILDTYALRRFIAKAVFGLVFIGYVLRKIKTKSTF